MCCGLQVPERVSLRAFSPCDWAYLITLTDAVTQHAYAERGHAAAFLFTAEQLQTRAAMDAFVESVFRGGR
jgi:hypothetical protein